MIISYVHTTARNDATDGRGSVVSDYRAHDLSSNPGYNARPEREAKG